MTTVYITKYCLTSSIFKIEAELKDCVWSKKKVSAWGNIPRGVKQNFYNEDFHLTEEDALKDAEIRKNKKIESLKKQIVNLGKKKIIVIGN